MKHTTYSHRGNIIRPGDILMIKNGKGIVPLGIQFFMAIYKRKIGVSKIVPEKYHHAATIVQMWGEMYVAEAGKKGYQLSKLVAAYSDNYWKNKIDIIRPVPAYNQSEQELVSKYAANFSFIIIRYDFLNFWYQIKKSFTGRWTGPTGEKAKKRLYCSEGAATLAELVRPGTFHQPEGANPVDLVINKNFERI